MREYTVIKTTNADVASGYAWEIAPSAQMDVAPWGGGTYRPASYGQLVCTEDAFWTHMVATEKKANIRAKASGIHPAVWEDSAMELFFAPLPELDPRYVNLELNTCGAVYIGVRPNRAEGRLLTETDINIFQIKNTMEETGEDGMVRWTVTCRIPFSFLETHYGKHDFAAFETMRGNFQKCGDQTPEPHLLVWNMIDWPEPDFHQPQFFGLFKAEK